ncbi:MAG: ferrochelatase, partial [Longimicrobiales bacterium]|nr:ferrochelatase [Longimicrobiales bacterium]
MSVSPAIPTQRKVGVLVINFGEPDEPILEKVMPFLERIFLQNSSLEPDESGRERARQLARQRAPGLIEEYREIGGSPLNEQADRQASELQRVLEERKWDVTTYSCFQFTEPSIAQAAREAKADGVEILVALPVYPICGQSTTVAALHQARKSLEELSWSPTFVAISGWHHHPAYVTLRVDHARDFLERSGLDLDDPETLLCFSVHGTPLEYL